MQSSWKTTLGGLLGSAGAALAASPDPTTAHIGQAANAIGLLILGFAARDNDKTSEEVGAKDAALRRAYPEAK